MTTRIEGRRTAGGAVGAGITHLLRLARAECPSALAFVAASFGGEEVVAASPDPGGLAPGAALLDDLVQHLRLDPGIARGKALLRTVQLDSVHIDTGHIDTGQPDTGQADTGQPDTGQPAGHPMRLAVATVPLGGGAAGPPCGFLGVADPDVKSFGFAELERLSTVARRLASYVAARREVRRQVDAASPLPTDGAAVSTPSAPASAPTTMPAPPPTPSTPPSPAAPNALADLQSPHALLDRARRLLGVGAMSGSIAVVGVEFSGAAGQAEEAAATAARAIRAELRYDDPVARLGETGFLAVVPLAPGGPDADALARRLVTSVRAALGGAAAVRSAHVCAELSAPADVVELVREVRGRLLRDGSGAPLAR